MASERKEGAACMWTGSEVVFKKKKKSGLKRKSAAAWLRGRKIIFRAGELSSHVGRVLERKEKKRKGKKTDDWGERRRGCDFQREEEWSVRVLKGEAVIFRENRSDQSVSWRVRLWFSARGEERAAVFKEINPRLKEIGGCYLERWNPCFERILGGCRLRRESRFLRGWFWTEGRIIRESRLVHD